MVSCPVVGVLRLTADTCVCVPLLGVSRLGNIFFWLSVTWWVCPAGVSCLVPHYGGTNCVPEPGVILSVFLLIRSFLVGFSGMFVVLLILGIVLFFRSVIVTNIVRDQYVVDECVKVDGDPYGFAVTVLHNG